MQKRSFKQRASAVALAAAMAITLSVAPTTQSNAASKQKVNVITTAKTSGGATIKYTYNKKGLVKKSVSKSSYKASDSDNATTTTVTYKYNKKNKISSKTTKTVNKETFYQTDKTTGQKIVATLGTITTTDTVVTKYTYNKKGLATKSVSTRTETKSGSKTETSKSLGILKTETSKSLGIEGTELSDGRIIAGYNPYAADGSYTDDHTAANAYYYGGTIAAAETTTTTTTTYTPNANGSYTETISTTKAGGAYDKVDVKRYFVIDYISGVRTIIQVFESKNESGGKVYLDASGVNHGWPDFSITDSVNVVPSTTASTSTDTTTNVISAKAVDTTKYTYDKKKRVKKEVSTVVYSSTKASNTTNTTSSASGSSEKASKEDDTYEETSTSTTTYTYDKKGRAKKMVYSEPGKTEAKSTCSKALLKDNETLLYKDETGAVTETDTETNTYTYPNGYDEVETVVISNGTKTKTVTYNPWTNDYTDTTTYASGNSNSKKGKREYTAYGNGGMKSVDNYTRTEVYNGVTTAEVVSKTDYSFDKNGSSRGSVSVTNGTNSDGTPYTYSDATYYSGGQYTYDVAATVAMAPAIAANEASGLVYNEVTTAADLATPFKSTTKYAYDKSGNLKTSKTTGTDTDVTTVKNEVYGNTIYAYDTNGKPQEVEQTYTHKFTNNGTKENTVKTGTTNLTKVLSMSKGTYDRSKSSGYDLDGRVIYTLKAKKYASKTAKLVKKQQWMIQNGGLNGVIGL